MKSPFSTVRDVPPSMAVPVRFSAFVRASFTSLPPVTIGSIDHVEQFRLPFVRGCCANGARCSRFTLYGAS